MTVTEVAHEALQWMANPAHVGGDCAIAAGFVAVGVVLVNFAKPYFARPTPTGFDDPTVKASRQRSARLRRDLGIGQPNEP